MVAVDLADDVFVVVSPAVMARAVADPGRWRGWWPDLHLTVTRDRGIKGQQWAVQGALVGTAEIWLEPWGDGVLVHQYLRVDPPAPRPQRWLRRERRRRALSWKRAVHTLKDEMESGRQGAGG